MLAETMADTRAGKIDPKLGSTLGYLGTALLRAFEVADFEQRLERDQVDFRREMCPIAFVDPGAFMGTNPEKAANFRIARQPPIILTEIDLCTCA